MQTAETKIESVKVVARERTHQSAAGFIASRAMKIGDLSAAYIDALMDWDEPQAYCSAPRMYCGL